MPFTLSESGTVREVVFRVLPTTITIQYTSVELQKKSDSQFSNSFYLVWGGGAEPPLHPPALHHHLRSLAFSACILVAPLSVVASRVGPAPFASFGVMAYSR